jgi:hypothetical protein
MLKPESLENYKLRYFTKYPQSTIDILDKTSDGFIIFKNKYGLCKTKSSDLLRNSSKIKIDSAINKSEYFVNRSKELFGDIYDYSLSSYITLKTKLIIICKKHGTFEKTPHAHLYLKQGCQKCGRELLKNKISLTNKKFIEKANLVHKFKYNYSKVQYTKNSNKIKIICPIHGIFEQIPNNHLSGRGCKKCFKIEASKRNRANPIGWLLNEWINKSKNSKNFDGFKLYILECWNEEEKFYKIGRTFNTLFERFKFNKIPYKYKILKLIKSSAEEIYNQEINLKKINKKHKYIPKLKFCGMYECFNKLENYGNTRKNQCSYKQHRRTFCRKV